MHVGYGTKALPSILSELAGWGSLNRVCSGGGEPSYSLALSELLEEGTYSFQTKPTEIAHNQVFLSDWNNGNEKQCKPALAKLDRMDGLFLTI